MGERGRPPALRFVIWWLDPAGIEIGQKTGAFERLPEYIRDEITGLDGRHARRRLWVPEKLRHLVNKMTNEGELDHWGDQWGGVVIWHRDRAKVAFMPGFVTDLDGFICEALTNAIRDYPAKVRP